MHIPVKLTAEQDASLEKFLHHCHRKHYPAKTTIIHEGDRSDTLYYIIDGSVSVLIEDKDDREIVLAYLNPGDFFGEMGLFVEDLERSAWVVARTSCELAEINYAQFKTLAMDYPKILWWLTTQLAARLRKTNQKVSDLAFLDVTGRVAHTLLELANSPDAITHPDGMQIRMTRQEIAKIVGCSREMVGRVLKELEAEGFITAKGKTMVVFGTR